MNRSDTRRLFLAALMLGTLMPGCRDSPHQGPTPIAASNSLLECAVLDLLGDATQVVRLAEPGMCPGHFDLRPSQVAELRHCRLLLRLDFQSSLDTRLTGATQDGLHIAEVTIPGGLCEPESYLSACRQTAGALVKAGHLDRAQAGERLAAIEQRLANLTDECHRKVAALDGLPVLASCHQEAFCRWLSLRVVATFRGADTESSKQFGEAVAAAKEARVRTVVANQPEGRKAADFLADGLGGRVVVFGNFPDLGGRHRSFDDLVADNVARLLEAVAGEH